MQSLPTDPNVRKPAWLRRGIPRSPAYARLRSFLGGARLHTVCEEARCPNCGECFARGTATFLILGDVCTRGCRFCAVARGKPAPPDPGEPGRVAEAAARMALAHVVVTSVTRDDLADGGAGAFAETIRALRVRLPAVRIEILIPDFRGEDASLQAVIEARPDILNHNLETVARLYPEVRPQAVYSRSLALLRRIGRSGAGIAVKSGLMLGLGETLGEMEEALRDLFESGCRILTLGQYLQPAKKCLPAARYVLPEEFDTWRDFALGMGFERVASGPLVRSSYRAGELCGALPGANEGAGAGPETAPASMVQ